MVWSGVARTVNRAKEIQQVKGTGGMLKWVIDRPVHRVSSWVEYYRYRDRYPRNVIFIPSMAKSGSTWLANMFTSLDGFRRHNPVRWRLVEEGSKPLEIYPGMLAEFDRRLAVVKSHAPGSENNAHHLREAGMPYLLTVRDPRDALISSYWYIRNRPVHRHHGYAMSVDLAEWLRLESDPSTAKERQLTWLRGWMENRDTNASIVIRYEDLVADTVREFGRALDFLGFDTKAIDVSGIVTAHSFETVSGRKRGEGDEKAIVRKGSPGEWRDVYTDDVAAAFNSRFGDVIEAFGYELTA